MVLEQSFLEWVSMINDLLGKVQPYGSYADHFSATGPNANQPRFLVLCLCGAEHVPD